MLKRGYRVVDVVPEFYKVTRNVMVCPPLDGLDATEVFQFEPDFPALMDKLWFYTKLKEMVSVDNAVSQSEQQTSLALFKVQEYMNTNHDANYILYNLHPKRQFDAFGQMFHQITEYAFPAATMVEGLSTETRLSFSTPPPNLQRIFLIVLEMASWINTSPGMLDSTKE